MNHITTLITSLGQFVTGDVDNLSQVLRRLKLLWQLVLGVEEGATNGELLIINNISFVSIASSSDIGEPEFSRGQIEILDDQTGFNDDASLYIGVLNKVRKVVYQHSSLVHDLTFHEFVSKLLVNDLEHLLDGKDDAVVLDCQDSIFVDCYKRGSNMLLMAFDESGSKDDIMKLLTTASNSISRAYLKKKGLLQIIELDKLNNYHQEIIDVMKYVFRKHPGYDSLLDDFFNENPIFPGLIQLNESTLTIMNKLDMPLIINILTQMCQTEKEKNKDIPITMEYLPQILKYYINSLNDEGETDVENDFYIKMIKSCTLKWIDEKIDTEEYSKQLIDLSLVPSAMPYVYRGVDLPNIHMRRALYDLKEEIRLKDVYFNGWLQNSTGLPVLFELENQWNAEKLQMSWNLMVDKFNKIHDMETISVNVYEETIICKNFSIWIDKMINLREAEQNFTKFYIQKNWILWKLKHSKLNDWENSQLKAMKVAKLRAYFYSWKNAKDKQYIGQHLKFQLMKRQRIFTLWKTKYIHKQNEYDNGDKIYHVNLKRRMQNIWMRKSKTPLDKVNALATMEREFSKRKPLTIWMQKTKLEKVYRDVVVKRNEVMLNWAFGYYLAIIRLRIQGSELESRMKFSTLNGTFQQWKLQHDLNKKADCLYTSKLLNKIVKSWKLKIKENQLIVKRDKALLSDFLKNWRMEMISSRIVLERSGTTKLNIFNNWEDKVSNQMVLVCKSDEVRRLNLKKLYYAIWKSYNNALSDLEIQELEFQNRNQARRCQIKYILYLWMLNTFKIQAKNKEIEKRERMFNIKKCDKYILIWRKRYKLINKHEQMAINRYSKDVLNTTFEKWLNRFDTLYDKFEEILVKRDDDDVSRAKHILSRWSMKMIKIKNDENKCIEFLNRWQKQRKLVFWEIWRMKPKMRQFELNPFDDSSTMSTPTPLEKKAIVTPRRSPIRQRSETSLLQSVERVRRRELAERIERYKFR